MRDGEPATTSDPQAGGDGLERAVAAAGRRIARAYPPPLRHPARALDRRAMDLVAGAPEVQAAIFRFVDATPACRTPQELAEHLEAFLGEVDGPPAALRAPARLTRLPGGPRVVGAAAGAAVRHMAQRFIVGESPAAALGHLRALWDGGAAASLDLLGEATVTPDEADAYAARCLDAVDVLSRATRDWPPRPVLEHDSLGTIPRANVSVKVSALTPLLRPHAPERGVRDAGDRLRPLLRRARDAGAHLHVDMESVDTLEATMGLVLALLEEDEFRSGPSAGMVVQAYLRDSGALLERIVGWAARTGRAVPLTVRLVKGAYWDHEVAEARQRGWEPPVFTEKAESDRNFETLTRRLVDAGGTVRPAIGSHNLRSVAHALAFVAVRGHPPSDVEVQVLQGLGDDLRDALAHEGVRVRVYCPVGDLVEGMAYLVRRLLENTASTSFLRAQGHGVPLDELLRAP